MTDRERRLARALTRIAVARQVLDGAAADLPPDCERLIRVLERAGRSLEWAARAVRREMDDGEG